MATESKNAKRKKAKKSHTKTDAQLFPKKIKRRRQMPKGPNGGMELILVDDVQHLGRQGEIVEVKPGYGRNFLIPQGMATFVTPEAKQRLVKHKAAMEAIRVARLNDLKMLAKNLGKVSITIEANATEEGHLYGSVTGVDIAAKLREQSFQIDEEQVRLEGPLRELGLYQVRLALAEEVDTEIKVWLVPQGGEAPTS